MSRDKARGRHRRASSRPRVLRSCGWCHAMNKLASDAQGRLLPTNCTECGHRVDLPRLHCDCVKCTPKPLFPGLDAWNDC